MKVCLLKDVENVGITGQVLKVSDGFARNYLVPRKLAVVVTKKDEAFYAQRAAKVQVAVDAINTKMGLLAERIKNTHLTIAERAHDDGKLYGAINADEIVTLLAEKDIAVTKKQIVFNKAVRSLGEHKVAIKLSSKMLPELTLKVTEKK